MRFGLAVVCLLVLGSVASVGAVPDGHALTDAGDRQHNATAQASVHAVYPDPVAGGDTGEFVLLTVPPGTNLGAYSLSDGDATATLPNQTVGGRVALSPDPAAVRNLTNYSVVGLDANIRLANGGETVTLRRNGTVLSRVSYTDTAEGELGVVRGSTVDWRPVGATNFSVRAATGGTVRAFTLPDAPDVPLAPIRNATDRVYLAGYTLTSERVTDTLIAAHERGVDVRVLLEGDPVGGRTEAEGDTLDRLSEAGIEVRVVTGPYARYEYHHAKYAVADDRAVVMTENWKPAGTGGNSSRGWGVVTEQSEIVTGLVDTFEADAGWRDAAAWDAYRDGRTFQRGGRATTEYPSRFDPASVPVNRTELLVTPDNAQGELVAELDAAEESIDVIQPAIGGWDEPLVTALRRAANRGVEVRILLSSAWYVREENRRTVDRFEAWAERTGAPLSARVADPGERYGNIHAKGAIIDDERVVLGSLNWNEQAATVNREVVLVLHGTAVADYFGRVFDADWTGGRPNIPAGLVAAVLGVLVIGGLAARRIRFAR
jgi:phosphatidylserine/phosphatidylglycerophosphate/cardiolipin synthase-like enzyme